MRRHGGGNGVTGDGTGATSWRAGGGGGHVPVFLAALEAQELGVVEGLLSARAERRRGSCAPHELGGGVPAAMAQNRVETHGCGRWGWDVPPE